MLSDNVYLSKSKELVIELKKRIALLKQKLTNYKLLIIDDDIEYKKTFESSISPIIQSEHQKCNLSFCAFCVNLKKSACHKYCFSCSKSFFSECGLLLPGTFPFMTNYLDSEGNETMPWTLIPGCNYFEQLDNQHYFDNFVSIDDAITIAFYEAVEGLYLGISRGKRPCHICASINLEIYNSCYKSENFNYDNPCTKVLENVMKYY